MRSSCTAETSLLLLLSYYLCYSYEYYYYEYILIACSRLRCSSFSFLQAETLGSLHTALEDGTPGSSSQPSSTAPSTAPSLLRCRRPQFLRNPLGTGSISYETIGSKVVCNIEKHGASSAKKQNRVSPLVRSFRGWNLGDG